VTKSTKSTTITGGDKIKQSTSVDKNGINQLAKTSYNIQ